MNTAQIDSQVMDYLEDLIAGRVDRSEALHVASRLSTYAETIRRTVAEVAAAEPLPFDISQCRLDLPHPTAPPHTPATEPSPGAPGNRRYREVVGRVVLYLHKEGPRTAKDIGRFVGLSQTQLIARYLDRGELFARQKDGASYRWAATDKAVAEYLTATAPVEVAAV